MRICIAKVGADASDALVKLGADYVARIRSPYSITIKAVGEKSRGVSHQEKQIKEKEGRLLLEAVSGYEIVALHETGKIFTSEQFSAFLQKKGEQAKPLAFLIGGPSGLSEEVLQKASLKLSLSPMTFPHRMAFCMLAEQLYRSTEILLGGPYHK